MFDFLNLITRQIIKILGKLQWIQSQQVEYFKMLIIAAMIKTEIQLYSSASRKWRRICH